MSKDSSANVQILAKAAISADLYYPKGGEIFEALVDVEISYLTHFLAPYTGGAKAMLLKGEQVIINPPSQEMPFSYRCDAVRSEDIEKCIIPRSDSESYKYDGYSLSIKTILLNTHFRIV